MVKFLYLIYILIRELMENNSVRKSIPLRTVYFGQPKGD